MKQLTNFFASIAFILAVFSCTESGDQVVTAKGNKHDNARTATYTDLSGTVTLPAGTYDEIRIANGSNVTLAHGVSFNKFNWGLYTPGGAGITITVPSGAAVSALNECFIMAGVTFTNRGAFRNKVVPGVSDGRLRLYGNFNNYGTHEVYVMQVAGNYYQKPFGNLSGNTVVQEAYTSGRLDLEGCSITSFKEIGTWFNPAPFLYGKGKISITDTGTASIIRGSVLTGDANTRVCPTLPLSFPDGGSFGIGQQTCSGGCF